MSEPSPELHNSRLFAERTLNALVRRNIPPTPNNFAVWYAHLTGEHPELSRAIEALDSARTEFTSARCAELHAQLIGERPTAAELREAGERISQSMSTVMNLLQTAGGGAKRYGQALGKAAEGMEAGFDAEQLRGVVATMLGETRRMIAHTEEIGGKLEAASREVQTLRRQIDATRREALIDPLTGIGNRKMFDEQLHDCMRLNGEGQELCLVMADIDHFKKFNDNYGHQLGDLVLRLVARALTEGIKGRDLAARYGGEEFAVILPQTKLGDAFRVADQLRIAIAAHNLRKRDESRDLGHVTLSMGVAQYRHGEDVEKFVERADAALYWAKNNGRNRVATERELAPGATAAR